eukprot:SAG11_NODE_296_length_11092_cov_24.402620_6_plen_106_part_00
MRACVRPNSYLPKLSGHFRTGTLKPGGPVPGPGGSSPFPPGPTYTCSPYELNAFTSDVAYEEFHIFRVPKYLGSEVDRPNATMKSALTVYMGYQGHCSLRVLCNF